MDDDDDDNDGDVGGGGDNAEEDDDDNEDDGAVPSMTCQDTRVYVGVFGLTKTTVRTSPPLHSSSPLHTSGNRLSAVTASLFTAKN